MMLIDKVRAATRLLHQSLDQRLVAHIDILENKQQYAHLLLLFYGFFKPVYSRIDAGIDILCLPDYLSRRRPEQILIDLDELGLLYQPHLCRQLPVIDSNAAAFGALYVLEGSTLGGVMIKKMIADKLHTTTGLSFFGGYQKQTRDRWNSFVYALNNLNLPQADEAVVVDTAAATFTAFDNWLQQAASINFTITNQMGKYSL